MTRLPAALGMTLALAVAGGSPPAAAQVGPWLEGPDGLVCDPHGAHVHCR